MRQTGARAPPLASPVFPPFVGASNEKPPSLHSTDPSFPSNLYTVLTLVSRLVATNPTDVVMAFMKP